MPTRSLSPRVGLAILMLVLFGACALRLRDLNQSSVWHDEAWSIRAIRDPINTPDDNTPFVYYTAMHIARIGIGETPLALRYGSVLLDLLTIALAARIVRRWAGWDVAVLTAVFFATSPLLWAYAREIRAYVAVPLLTLVLLWGTDEVLRPRARWPWRWWGGLLLAEITLLYTHNLSVPVIAWLNLVVGGVWLYRRAWRTMAIWLAGQAIAFVAYLPWLLGQSPSGTPLNTPPEISLAQIWDTWQGYFAPLPAQIGAENALVLGTAVFGVVGLLSVTAALTWNRNQRTLLLLSQAILIPALATVELIVANIDFHPRYYIAAVPATLILIALGIDSLPDEYDLRRIAIPGAMAVAIGVGAASLTRLLDQTQYQHDDFRAIAKHYTELPPTAIIVIPYGWEPALEEYYRDELNIEAEIVGVELHSDAAEAIAEINAALAQRGGPVTVELLTWYQLPADERGMYPCLLEAAGQRGETFTVQGLSTQRYTIERPLALAGTPDIPAAIFGPINLTAAALDGDESICVHTSWELPAETSVDWRVSGRLAAPVGAGWAITSSDTDIRADDQAPTSDWEAGGTGSAFSVLRLPAGTPPGAYDVSIRVYSSDTPDGLVRLVDGIPTGGLSLPIGTVSSSGNTSNSPSTPPTPAITPITSDVELLGYDVPTGPLFPGQEVRITLYWHNTGATAWTAGVLALRGDAWHQSRPVTAHPVYNLDWHTFTVPPDANGTASLALEVEGMEPVAVAAYNLQETDHLLTAPPFDVAVGAIFPGVGVLEGFSVNQTTFSTDKTLELILVWRVTDTPDRSLTVFTHILDAGYGQIGGHDGIPHVNGEARPVTGWVPGEYLMDTHVLTFEAEDLAYTGPARLEVGLYDSETLTRVPLNTGGDHIILPIELTVQ
ncbi:MAG: hypothetical protein GYB65_10895 [Chloroflexi bacterium]|nr:hypothetical protein [Chloroflexota bacterium]